MCIVAFVDLVAPAALSPPPATTKVGNSNQQQMLTRWRKRRKQKWPQSETKKLTWAWRLQRLSERRFRVCNAEGCRLNTGLPSTSTAKRISVPSGHPSSDNVDNVPSTHTSITVRAASAGVGRRRSAAWLLVVSSGTSSAASTIATTAAPTAATLPPLPFPAPPLLHPLFLVLNPERQTREEEEEQGAWNQNSVGDCDVCDCRRKYLLLELRKRMAEFDDKPFRSSSMCVCVCVCVCVQQIQQTSLQPRLVQKKLQKAVKSMNIIFLLACRSVSPSFLLLSNFYSSLKTLKSRFFFFQDPDSRFWQQLTNHQKTSSCTT